MCFNAFDFEKNDINGDFYSDFDSDFDSESDNDCDNDSDCGSDFENDADDFNLQLSSNIFLWRERFLSF